VAGNTLLTNEELALSKHLLRLEEVLREVERSLYPNALCEYLFELSSLFNKFYENCPVLKAETVELRASRTALCSLSADALKLSLGLLGIDTLEQL
jgi:arginyl-tRNA synthetase